MTAPAKALKETAITKKWIILSGEVQDENCQILAAEVDRAAGANYGGCHARLCKGKGVKLFLTPIKYEREPLMKKITVTSACSAFQWPIAAEFVYIKI